MRRRELTMVVAVGFLTAAMLAQYPPGQGDAGVFWVALELVAFLGVIRGSRLAWILLSFDAAVGAGIFLMASMWSGSFDGRTVLHGAAFLVAVVALAPLRPTPKPRLYGRKHHRYQAQS